MEYPRVVLVVLTLLQLCRAKQIPQWYSAKINDGFQPKSISEIFSSEPTFSTAQPIVVTDKLSYAPGEYTLLSTTLAPPTNQFESTTYSQSTFPSTTTSMPAGALYQQPQLEDFNPIQVDILPQQVNQPLQVQPVQKYNTGPQEFVTEIPQFTQETLQTQRITDQTYTARSESPVNKPQTQWTISSEPTQAVTKPPPLQYSSSTPLEFSSSPTLQYSSLPPTQYRQPNPNYFLIYQQGAQANPAYPVYVQPPTPGVSEVTIRETLPTTVSLPMSSSTQTIPTSSFSTTTPLPTTWLSTTPLSTSTLSSSSVTITPSSNLGVSAVGCITPTTPIPNPLRNVKTTLGIRYPLKIRVVAPRGSITNVNINPVTTTKKPVTKRTTTRKPTTKRTKTSKPKKNSHDRCLDGCRKVKDPICAAPLSHREIDPKTLRGFASVCHMACHNSYRKDPFEKLMDGTCSKLRTQIRLIDSRKVKKDELRKNEYTVDQGTVIELSALE